MQKGPLNWKANKRMKALGVDQNAKEAYELEKRAGFVKAGADVIVTKSWLMYDSAFKSALFPLKEIESFYKTYTPTKYSGDFHVVFSFKDGGNYKIRSHFEELDFIAAALAGRGVKQKRAQHLGLFG